MTDTIQTGQQPAHIVIPFIQPAGTVPDVVPPAVNAAGTLPDVVAPIVTPAVTPIVAPAGTHPDVAITGTLPTTASHVPAASDTSPPQESEAIPPTARAEGLAETEKLARLPAVDETLPYLPLEVTIGEIIDSLLGDDPPENDSHPPTAPANSPLPPPLRPGAHEDPAGERQTLVDPTEAPAIVEHYRRRFEKEL